MTSAANSPPIPGLLGRLASRLYRAAITRVNRRYDKGVGIVTFDRPVISVGNLSTGGTGKTPMVLHVVRTLRAAGHDPCIAMRGYGHSDGSRSDEALEYARLLTNVAAERTPREAVPIVAQPNRTAGLIDLFATQRGRSVDSIVLDDAFQHRKIARTLDIVLIDATRSPFEDSLLPAGHLREPVSSLSRASAIVLTHAESAHADGVATLHVQIHEQQPKALIAVARHAWRHLNETGPAGDHQHPTAFLRAKRVAALVAIGNSHAFFNLTKAHAGQDLVLAIAKRDHDPYSDSTITDLLAQLTQVRPDVLVTTEKDWSKLSRVAAHRWPCPVLRPSLELTFDSGGPELDSMILAACR
jgi:tetraacyldisaccharide 4'-kinase